ncbi:MAG TPA: peptidylprolyl isomerase [Polyangiaceae bacterium]|jgi:peptidyl-prolyl cis-trans isomerase A (cyclophilin A)|nr:peptidylprolyl isomerase [Polyangiaceae bacterium]
MKASLPLASVSLLASLALAACSKATPEPGQSSSSGAETTAAASSAPAPGGSAALASVLHPALLDPANATDTAPDVYKAKFTTSKGAFVVEVHRDWAPHGADRFYDLVKLGYFDDTRFFRAVDGFMVQFGINGDPAVNAKWQSANVTDDPVKGSNKRGFMSFAQTNMPNSRSTQVFINYADNARLDGMRFAPFAEVVQGMDIVDSLYKGYGEGAPGGMGPDQGRVQAQGNAYLDKSFPKLDAIKHAEIVN